MKMKNTKITIIGLGYVGLPLARLFATKYSVVGFDINTSRISELQKGIDSTLEIDQTTLVNVLKQENNNEIGLFLAMIYLKFLILIIISLLFLLQWTNTTNPI